MSQLVRICDRSQLPKLGEAKEFAAGSRVLCVANVDGVMRALDNECPHHGGPLAEGMVEAGKVVCPWHGWAFDPATGITDSSQERVAIFPIKLDGEAVFVTV